MSYPGPAHARVPSSDDTRHHIVQSLFSKTDDNGTAEETLISYVKVYEDDSGPEGMEQKTRYLMLAVTKLGKVVIHKAKRNNNLTFSKGKTWGLEDMRVVEVIGPTDFALTMTIRRYHWQTERPREQGVFLNALVKVYRTYTKGQLPQLINFALPAGNDTPPATGQTPPPGGPRGPSPAITSPPLRHMDLAPPPRIRDVRSNSSNSMASSGGGSSYERDRSMSHTSSRPSIDEQRSYPFPNAGNSNGNGNGNGPHGNGHGSGNGFGRSPLSDSGMLPLGGVIHRRPSEQVRQPSASTSTTSGNAIPPVEGRTSPYGGEVANGHGRSHGHDQRSGSGSGSISGLGIGAPPPANNRRTSGHSLAPHGPRTMSGGSNGERMRKTSSDGLRKQVSSEGLRAVSEEMRDRDDGGMRTPQAKRSSRGSRESRELTPSGRPRYEEVFEEDDDKGRSQPQLQPPNQQPAQGTSTNATPLTAPTITHTLPSPAMPSDPNMTAVTEPPKSNKVQRRASFHPPPLTTAFSREVLLTSKTGILPGAAGLTLNDGEAGQDAIMNNVEEMLEGFDWTVSSINVEAGRKKGSADAIEGRLLDELSALDSANIHAFLESDDRIAQVLGHIDEALLELDDIDLQLTGYKMQLNAVAEDISFIESQSKGLQVQTSNQQALLNELRQLLQIVEVPPEDLRVLTQESPGSARGVQNLEKAAASLYKALQAGMDTANAEVAATIARMREYQENSAQFCKRLFDYLDITFKHQSDSTLAEYRKTSKKTSSLAPHTSMGEFLMMYEGLVLYIKEMDEERYQRLCSNYMSTISQLHQAEMKDLLMSFMATVNAASGEERNEASFAAAAGANAPKPSALQKSKAVIGLRSSDVTSKDKRGGEKNLPIAGLYQKALGEIINQMVIEEDFINAFLHLTDTESTFADHMELDSYFRRQAARHASRGLSVGMMQLVRSMMDLVFGFVELELKNWVEASCGKDPIAIVGVIAVSEKIAAEAEQENTSLFFSQLFEKQLARQRAALDGFVAEQIRTIDGAKSSVKRRKGVTFFVKHFPIFVEKMEAQLEGAEGLPIRAKVNGIYERVVDTVFGSVQQLAKLDRGEGQAAEDKGQLNYHVVMIENMRHFVDDVSNLNTPVVRAFVERAQALYDENLSQYIKLLFRRSFGRLIDFFDNVDRVMQTTPANEISLHPACSKSALKKVLRDYSAKDMRKSVDAMAKRVDKHFTNEDDPSSLSDPSIAIVVTTVWKEISSELKRETGRIQEMIGRCYSDSNLGIEYGPVEVEAACKRAKGV